MSNDSKCIDERWHIIAQLPSSSNAHLHSGRCLLSSCPEKSHPATSLLVPLLSLMCWALWEMVFMLLKPNSRLPTPYYCSPSSSACTLVLVTTVHWTCPIFSTWGLIVLFPAGAQRRTWVTPGEIAGSIYMDEPQGCLAQSTDLTVKESPSEFSLGCMWPPHSLL